MLHQMEGPQPSPPHMCRIDFIDVAWHGTRAANSATRFSRFRRRVTRSAHLTHKKALHSSSPSCHAHFKPSLTACVNVCAYCARRSFSSPHKHSPSPPRACDSSGHVRKRSNRDKAKRAGGRRHTAPLTHRFAFPLSPLHAACLRYLPLAQRSCKYGCTSSKRTLPS